MATERASRGVSALAALCALTSGCALPGPSAAGDSTRPVWAHPPAARAELARPEWRAFGLSVEGRPLEVAVLGEGRTTVLLIGSIHGSETAGTPLLRELAERLAREPELRRGCRVVIAPLVNPDGAERGARSNARGVDLNRNFPAANWSERESRESGGGSAPLSEPESRFVAALVEGFAVDRIVSLHEPVGVLDHDGPAEDLVRRMAAAGPLPAQALGARAGSLGSWAGVDRRIPTITVELPASAKGAAASELWARYGALLLAALG